MINSTLHYYLMLPLRKLHLILVKHLSNLVSLILLNWTWSDDEDEGDELARYFDAPRASSETDPVQWWFTRRTESPRMYCMARDLMAIPGVSCTLFLIFFYVDISKAPLLLLSVFSQVVGILSPFGVHA